MKAILYKRIVAAIFCSVLLTSACSFAYGSSESGIEIRIHDYGRDIHNADPVAGTVLDEQNKPVAGVSVSVKGTETGTVTDDQGHYSLQAEKGQTIVFSSIGYNTLEIKFQGQQRLDVSITSSAVQLNEVVAIGYGSVKKRDLTGAVSVINQKDLQHRYSSDIAGALTGLASGIKVTSSGQAGASSAITIRGIGNLTNNNPLFVVDGLPTNGGMDLNLQDIESIQVLKDASAAAIYGSRAANGVIIITTKKGQTGPLKVTLSGQVDVSWLPRYNLLDRAGYIKYDDAAYDEAIRLGIATKRQSHFNGNTDWQDEELKTGVKQNYNLSLQGGSKNGTYYMSMNKLIDPGTLYGTSFDRYAFRVNTAASKGIFSYGENFYIIKSKTKGMTGNPFQSFITMPPTVPVHDPAHPGGYGYGDPDSANTYAINPIANQDLQAANSEATTIQGNLFGEAKLFRLITARLNFGYSGNFGVNNTLRKNGNWTMGQAIQNFLSKTNSNAQTLLLENTYRFEHTFGKHSINAVAGISYQHDNSENLWTTRLDPLVVNGHYYQSLDAATGLTTGGGQYGEAALLSYLGRANYAYDDRYLLTVTFRRDGSSRLPLETRWGNFPSISGAWRISRESFFKIPFINELKIRASYGELGGANIGNWDYLAVMNTSPRAVLGVPEQVQIGTTQSQLVNTDISWEKTIQKNFGFDASILDSRMSISAEYFIKTSKDLLVPLPILLTTGNNGGNPIVNAASIENRGVEVDLGWRDKIGEFSYGVSLNLTKVNNKLLDLGYGKVVQSTFLTKSEIGKPLGSFFLYKDIGIFQSADEVAAYQNKAGTVIQPNALPGDIKYDDYNGDGIIASDDREIVGSPWPKLETGLTINASYKSFDVAIQGFGRFGFDIWNGSRAAAADFSTNQNNFKDINPWTPDNTNTDQPRLVYGDTRNSRGDQSRWLENGTFFRIGEISFGYTIPRLFGKDEGSQGHLAVTLVNMFTFTGYSGLDPDFLDTGIFTLAADNCAYPNARAVQFSFSVNF